MRVSVGDIDSTIYKGLTQLCEFCHDYSTDGGSRLLEFDEEIDITHISGNQLIYIFVTNNITNSGSSTVSVFELWIGKD